VRTLLLLLLLLLCAPVWARPSVQEVFAGWLAQDRLRNAHVGFLLVRLADGKVLASHDPDKLFVPASTAKVMTAKAVLDAGELKPLRTSVWLHKDRLILWGEGDPELTSADLQQMAETVSRREFTQISKLSVGSIYSAPLNPLGRGWAWDDAVDDYSAVISGLTVDRGTASVTMDPREHLGDRPAVTSLEPLAVWARADAFKGEANYGFARVPGRAGTVLWGLVDMVKPTEAVVTLSEPDLAAGRLLVAKLAERGVSVGEVDRMDEEMQIQWDHATVREEVAPEEKPAVWDLVRGELLAEHLSRPIEAILREALARSDNLAMELLIRVATGKPAPPSPPTARLVDGSGLSRYNLLSPRHLVEALQSSARLRDLMPLAGVEGTLKNRLKGLAYRQVRAKTGTVSTVSGLAGTLFPDEPDKACVFALLTNGFTGPGKELKQAEDVLIEELVRQLAYPYVLGQ